MSKMEMLNYFQERQIDVLSLIRRLCEIESPSHDAAGSREIAALLEAECGKLKIVDSIERTAAENTGEHLVIRAFSDLPGEPILLLGHTDTVHPRGSLAARPFRIEADKVFAPGIFDMKAGCAVSIATLKAFNELNLKPARPIVVLLSCDEEIGSETGRELVEREAGKSAFCLVLEPSANGKAKTGRKGTANYVLKAHGIPAHAGLEPERGASAVLEIAKQIPLVHQLNKPEIGTTANVCTISGGTTTNVIPEFAECSIDVRFASMDEARRIETAIKNLRPINERVSLEISGGINRPPLERSEKVTALFEKARKIAATFDYELGETQVGGASDGNFVAALGVPVLDGLGVAGDGAHTNHEHILASDIAPRAAIVAALVLSL